jgi:hypothetical protein
MKFRELAVLPSSVNYLELRRNIRHCLYIFSIVVTAVRFETQTFLSTELVCGVRTWIRFRAWGVTSSKVALKSRNKLVLWLPSLSQDEFKLTFKYCYLFVYICVECSCELVVRFCRLLRCVWPIVVFEWLEILLGIRNYLFRFSARRPAVRKIFHVFPWSLKKMVWLYHNIGQVDISNSCNSSFVGLIFAPFGDIYNLCSWKTSLNKVRKNIGMLMIINPYRKRNSKDLGGRRYGLSCNLPCWRFPEESH